MLGTCSCGVKPWPHVRESDEFYAVGAQRAPGMHPLAFEPAIRLTLGVHEYDTLRKTRSGARKFERCLDDARAPYGHRGMAHALEMLLARVHHGTDLVPQCTTPDKLTIVEWRHRLFAVVTVGRRLVR